MRLSPKARGVVSTLVVISVIGVWGYKVYLGEPVNPILAGIVVLYALAAGFVVFGRKAWSDAKETYDEVSDTASGDGGDSGE